MTRGQSSGNVFLDIGFDEFEAAELTVKADMVTLVARALRLRGLTQTAAAKLCGTHQTVLSKALSGKLESITLDRLAKWIVALGGDVTISVSQPASGAALKPGSLTLHGG
ncbi:MAG: XRE family transcriptional regulator [Proteobacteria bacterium]|nr:XRE family transcriptional regulator [Pseudomonadota bacterium]